MPVSYPSGRLAVKEIEEFIGPRLFKTDRNVYINKTMDGRFTGREKIKQEMEMDYIKIRLSSDLDQAGRGLRRTLDDIFGSANPVFYQLSRTWKPQMDLFETADEIKIIATLAGVDKESMEIEINERAVRISGNRYPPSTISEGTFFLAEIQYGKFERILFLPKPIDTDQVSASLSAGILQISMVKQRLRKSLKVPIRDEDE